MFYKSSTTRSRRGGAWQKRRDEEGRDEAAGAENQSYYHHPGVVERVQCSQCHKEQVQENQKEQGKDDQINQPASHCLVKREAGAHLELSLGRRGGALWTGCQFISVLSLQFDSWRYAP
ncbi:hypothetical protein CHARACLAT_024249 [Characodon lateralis]|uniref:Uncharacterized protein n=1 Tax=Characodon lateralis TaxID=208331 RepID=A0ABU7F855_9TELE|nr:hypothetical protein [Characodon lateralis]